MGRHPDLKASRERYLTLGPVLRGELAVAVEGGVRGVGCGELAFIKDPVAEGLGR
jgi:hypothetical protein